MSLLRIATLVLLVVLGSVRGSEAEQPGDNLVEGRDQRLAPTNRPTVEAAFLKESYAPGDTARLVIWTPAVRVSLQIVRAGTETANVKARDVMLGTPVTPARRIGAVAHGSVIRIRIGDWPSGLYFAELRGSGAKWVTAPSSCGRGGSAPHTLPSSSRR